MISSRTFIPLEQFNWLIWADSVIFLNQVKNLSTFRWFDLIIQSQFPYLPILVWVLCPFWAISLAQFIWELVPPSKFLVGSKFRNFNPFLQIWLARLGWLSYLLDLDLELLHFWSIWLVRLSLLSHLLDSVWEVVPPSRFLIGS